MFKCLFYEDCHLSFGCELIRLANKLSEQIRELSVAEDLGVWNFSTFLYGPQERL